MLIQDRGSNTGKERVEFLFFTCMMRENVYFVCGKEWVAFPVSLSLSLSVYIYIYIYIYTHIFSLPNKGSEADLSLFDPNPCSPASSGQGAPSLFNKRLAEQAIHALSFDHLRAVSPCCCFPPSSCSCLKVEVIPPERNTLGVLHSINLFLLSLLLS